MVPSSVTTHSGYKADEYPVSFTHGNTGLTVVEVEDRWYSPGCSYYRVFADDAGRYIMRHDSGTDKWTVKKV